jgi:hypothetical protein
MTPQHAAPFWCRIVILASCVLLLFASVTKLRAPSTFAETLSQQNALPASLIAPASWAVPSIELVLGLCGVCGVLLQRGVAPVGLAPVGKGPMARSPFSDWSHTSIPAGTWLATSVGMPMPRFTM